MHRDFSWLHLNTGWEEVMGKKVFLVSTFFNGWLINLFIYLLRNFTFRLFFSPCQLGLGQLPTGGYWHEVTNSNNKVLATLFSWVLLSKSRMLATQGFKVMVATFFKDKKESSKMNLNGALPPPKLHALIILECKPSAKSPHEMQIDLTWPRVTRSRSA